MQNIITDSRCRVSLQAADAEYYNQGCGNAMPDLSDMGNFTVGQVEFSCCVVLCLLITFEISLGPDQG